MSRTGDAVAAVRRTAWTTRVLARSGFLGPFRPDRYVGMVAALTRHGANAMSGIGLSAARTPDATALTDERGSLTWAELDARCDAAGAALQALVDRDRGAPAGGTVAVMCRNHRGLVEALAGATRAGLDVLLLNTGFSGPQLAEVLEREGATLVVLDEEFTDLLGPARERVPTLVTVLAWCDEPGADTLDGLVDQRLGDRPSRPARPGRTVLLTSGTTGTPKGAARSGGAAGSLAAMLERIPWRAGEPVVVAAPMFHAWGFGQLAIAATLGCPVVVRRRFDPESTLALVAEHRASGLALVPVMLERIIELPDEVLDRHRLPTLRFVTASGSRMRPDAVTAFMDRFGDVVHNSYNATEAGLISTAVPADLRVAPDTAGRAVAGTELRILDEDGREVATGEVGRITVRSGSHFEGYTSGDTKDFDEGFMVSGDLGRVDGEGRLFVVGRDDEMIVSGGENVYPQEVEETLADHDDVVEAAVLGVDDERFGQRLEAYVVLREGAGADEAALQSFVKERLAGYKVPRRVVVLDSLPRNETGKVLKRELGR